MVDLYSVFNRFMSPYEAEQARIYQKALGTIKPVKELNGTFDGWKFRYVYYSDGSVEVVDFSSSNTEDKRDMEVHP